MCTAQQVFDEWLTKPRTERSAEYKAGVLAGLKYCMLEADGFKNPYLTGTASADAWWAGYDYGRRISPLDKN